MNLDLHDTREILNLLLCSDFQVFKQPILRDLLVSLSPLIVIEVKKAHVNQACQVLESKVHGHGLVALSHKI